MSLQGTPCPQPELPVSKNMLLFLHLVAKGQIMQRSGPVWHFWRVVRVEGTHRLNSVGSGAEYILGQLWCSDKIAQEHLPKPQ